MLQAFIIVLREGFESFLIVAIIYAYLRKTGKFLLLPAVNAGIAVSVVTSAVLGYLLLQGANQPLWEGSFALISAVLVGWFVIHMWQTAGTLKKDMESSLHQATEQKATPAAWFGVFLFTVFMISREGMETALLLIQIQDPKIVSGIVLGIVAAACMGLAWVKVGHLINLKRFFQVTAIFLFLFILQILLYAFHEFTEAGILPNSEFLHNATEIYSPDGLYGKWFSLGMIAICAAWLFYAWIADRRERAVS